MTVVLATYNGELFIREQLDSILQQSFTDFQIIIGDDASTDSTFSILKEYEERYSDIIHVFQNQNRLGVVSNFEKLIECADTPYISLSDQDDIWYKDKLLNAVTALENLNDENIPLLFHSDLCVVNDERIKLYDSFFKMRGYSFPKERSIDIMLGRCGVMGNTIVFNQALKEKILPFPKSLAIHDYWIALVNEFFGKRVTHIEPLVEYRIHHSNTSNSLTDIKNSKILKKILHTHIKLPYHDIQREILLEEFLQRFKLLEKDKVILNHFLKYLLFKERKSYLISLSFKYKFFRLGIRYRLKLIGAILWKKCFRLVFFSSFQYKIKRISLIRI